MNLDFIPLDKLSVSPTNMRHGKNPPDVSDILPSVRKRGVLVPVLVRPDGARDRFEIVAGRRRFTAASVVADERREAGEDATPLPCAILDESGDADAVEASLIENVARRDPDEVPQWATFTRLVKEGRSVDDIAATFGLPELAVKRVLALGNLMPRIRSLYAGGDIDAATVRHPTLASKRQQQAWLALADDADAYCPTGHQLKAWLFGGQSISTAHAVFDVAASGLETVADLFGESCYFADSDAFWAAQNAAIEAKCAAYIEAGWTDAVIVPPSDYFSAWEYDKAAKRKGGRVYLDVRASGEVVIHEGYISRKEAARLARGEADDVTSTKPQRPEITATMQTYIDLHRHAAVRARLLDAPGVALRLMVAHAITGSPFWAVRPEPQTSRSDAISESLENCASEAVFDAQRRAVLALLGFEPDAPTVTGGNDAPYGLVRLFIRLRDMPDAAVMEVLAIVMGETLAAGGPVIEALGHYLSVDMAACWSADDALFDALHDKQIVNSILSEVAGESVAAANLGETAKVQKGIIRDHLDGTNGRAKIERWVPRWMRFPPSAYSERGGVGTVHADAIVAAVIADEAKESDADPAAISEGADDRPDPNAPVIPPPREPDPDADRVPLAV